MQSLETKSPALITESPNADNISYAVQVITPDPAQTFKTLVQELKEHKELTEDNYILPDDQSHHLFIFFLHVRTW